MTKSTPPPWQYTAKWAWIRLASSAPLKAAIETRGFPCTIVRPPKNSTKTPNQDRAKVMVEALKNNQGDVALIGISNHGLFMPLVAAERPVRRIVMINAVVPVPGKSFKEAFDFEYGLTPN